MAITTIWKIDKRLDHVIDYISDVNKTYNKDFDNVYRDLHSFNLLENVDYKAEKQFYVSALNCSEENPYKDMIDTKKRFLKEDGILGFHIIQSFDEKEVTPELAHKIGVEFANELFGDRFEVVVATHLNTKHYHNHILINSVSFKDGKKYYDTHTSYAILRKTSNFICQENGLKTLKEKTTRSGLNYDNFYNKHISASNYYITTKADIDIAIEHADTYREFINILEKMNYTVIFRAGKLSVRRPPYKRNIRIERAFGNEYSIELLKKRIEETHKVKVPFPELYSKSKTNYKGKRFTKKSIPKGISKLYLHYCYLLKVMPKEYIKHNFVPQSLKQDIEQMDRLSAEAKLLSSNRIYTTEQLFLYKEKIINEVQILKNKREILHKRIKNKSKSINIQNLHNEIEEITKKITKLKNEEVLCNDIETRLPQIKENMQRTKQNEKEPKEFNKQRGD